MRDPDRVGCLTSELFLLLPHVSIYTTPGKQANEQHKGFWVFVCGCSTLGGAKVSFCCCVCCCKAPMEEFVFKLGMLRYNAHAITFTCFGTFRQACVPAQVHIQNFCKPSSSFLGLHIASQFLQPLALTTTDLLPVGRIFLWVTSSFKKK